MGQKKKKLAKGRLDKFYYLAKEQGFRSRAAFKLIQLNKKYNFLGSAKACLDLCAAPGGWMQVASKYMPAQSVIVGVDLDPIRPIRNCIGLQEDITTAKCRAEIKKALKTWKVDICLHDGAPNMGTSWIQDAFQQAELTLHALKLATEFLTAGGWFVTKVFRGPDYNSLMWVFHQLFKKVDSTKPQASRNASAEIFVVCQGFLAPKKLDPKLLDPKHVFKEAETKVEARDVLKEIKIGKKIRHRDGYEDDASDLRSIGRVKDLIEANDHLQMLGKYWSLQWDVESKIYEDHPLTTKEIKECLADLKVLGKTDFKKLIKWKQEMYKYKEDLDGIKEEAKEKQEEEAKEEKGELDPHRPYTPEELEDNLDRLLQENMDKLAKRKKKEKKKESAKHKEDQRRVHLGMTIQGDSLEQSEEAHLFGLGQVDKDAQEDFGDTVHADIDVGGDEDFDMGSGSEDEDSGDELDDMEMMEQQLDLAYEEYLRNAKGKRIMAFDVTKVTKDKFIQDDDNEDQDQQDDIIGDSIEDQDTLTEKTKKSKSTDLLLGKRKPSDSSFFKNPLFAGVDGDDDAAIDPDLDIKKPIKKVGQVQKEEEEKEEKKLAAKKQKREKDPDADIPLTKKQQRRLQQKANREKKVAYKLRNKEVSDDEEESSSKKKNKQGFEEVPAEPEYGDDRFDEDAITYLPMEKDVEYESDSEEEEDEKIKTLAIGTAMLRKKAKQDIVDDAYNRYAHNDRDELPAWFMDDDKKHSQPNIPITKEMVEEIKREIRLINSRPIKKVAEAKARKKRLQMAKMEKAKDKATSVIDNSDMTGREKTRALEKIYKNADATKRAQKITLISRSFKTGGGTNKAYKVVDRRLKKDMRSQKAKEKRKPKKH
ncbi:rRNA methyltransferase [Cavenderia fasciculata]|uniref:Putative rRNA methyltransferase n=1 Tax=Cavenderia fasciculata TaxID=261658 RepID=F4PGW4_CACFS|nr:rRNA methyltransferase [Cavenderia fasciculata]EGG24948.1 rRNA methyltransferase [Cavenderia fasciculata]|eukprot:XP_004362799.1 rRNA methyltransferase [Cavenderia fasciculata]